MVAPVAGTLLGGRYLLEHAVAEGGMGAVWRARHIKLDVAVAVKLMSPVLAASEGARARFEREAKAAARLASPHVVEVHDYGVDGDTPYIVMEFLDGEDLAQRLENTGRLSVVDTVEIVEQIARALEVAHAAGVVHRDLKPGNVFLAQRGSEEIVKVLDFGIAKLRAEPGSAGTMPGTLMGSPSFMSPEQARGAGAIDHRSDLWALGVVAFVCMTGHLPFVDDDVAELIMSICAGEIPPASGFWPALGPEVDRFFERALARPVDERFQSARDLADALRAAAGLPPSMRRSLSPLASVRPPPTRPTDVTVGETSPARRDDVTTPIVTRGRGERGDAAPTLPGGASPPPPPEAFPSPPGKPAARSSTPSQVMAALRSDRLAAAREVIAGRFEIEEMAGEGGMGVAYRAKDGVTGATVALKILRPGVFDTERFFREARVLSEIRHPGVVRYVAHGVTRDARLYLAMEWLAGGDLARRLRSGVLDTAQSLSLVGRVAEALGAAHRRGIVHGDLKPNNVLLAGADVADVKVIDFGIARLLPRARGVSPRREQVLGTPGYMAPEQARGEADMDARADVFALGCLLFECITGRAPFMAETPLASLGRVVSQPAPKVRDTRPDVAEEVDELLGSLLAKARDDRPEDGAAAAELISRAAQAITFTPRSREAITTGERKILPVVLVVPAPMIATLSPKGLRFASEVRSEDATCALDDLAIDMSASLGPIARNFGARLEVLPGGALAAVWAGGAPLVDQAVQAAACALALREAEAQAAIAIAIGRRGAKGDVLDRAAATVVRAPGDAVAAIAVCDVTFGLLHGRFDIEESGGTYALRGRLRADGEERRLLGKTTPCAGREPELSMLEALFRECAEEETAKVVILKGPAGAGKSRVRLEFLRRLAKRDDDVRVWIGRGDVMSAGSPFAILSHALLAMLDLAGGEPDEARRERLRARVAESVAPEQAARVAAFLGDMIGIPPPEDAGPELAAAREDALLLGDQRRRAFEDFVAAESAKGPVVLVLEDLHLADLPTVKLLDLALRALAERPFFVLATARPDLDDLFPKIWEERVPQEIRVGPLSAKASEKIVRHVLGPSVAPDLVARIVSRAAGHPLHLEEILRAVAERAEGELPDTVLAMVEARIGALDPAARRVLRAASVFGRTFWESAVASLTPLRASDVRDWLHDLAEREWIARSPMPRFAGETEYTITQDLVQEAAYAMLTEGDRALGHRLAGEWLEHAGERDAIVLARHFELGAQPARAAGWLLRAAEQAEAANDFASAVKHAERMLEIDPTQLRAGRARAVLAEAHLHRGDLEASRRRGFEAMDLVPPTEASHFRACAAAVVASGKLGDIAAARSVAEKLLSLGPSPEIPAPAALAFTAAASHAVVQLVIGGDRPLAGALFERLDGVVKATPEPEPAALAYVARAAGARAAFAGDLFGSIVSLRAAAAAFEAAGDLRSACSTRKTLGWYLGECGAIEEAERSLRDSLALAAKMGLVNLAPHAKHDLGSPLLRLGKLEEARRLQEEALAAFQEQGDRRLESGAHSMLSAIALADGRLADAERDARAAIAIAPSAPIRFTATARLADALRAAGRHEEAVRAADEALGLLAESGTSEECLVVCLLARAESLVALGRADDAAATLARARAEIESRAEQIRDPDLRASFLSRIPENARVLELVAAGAA